MVAITAPARPFTPRPRVPRAAAPPLRLVSPGGRHSIPIGGRTVAELLLAAVLVVVSVFAVTYLVRSEPAPVGEVGVLDAGHVVEAGETMWSIASEVAPAGEAAGYVERLVDVNGGATVHAGQVLALPIP